MIFNFYWLIEISKWYRKVSNHPVVQRGQSAQVRPACSSEDPALQPLAEAPAPPISVSGLGPSSATFLVQEDSYPPSSTERTVITGETFPAAQSKSPETLRTQEPKSSLGQESSVFCPHPELIRATELHTQKQPQESRSQRSTYIYR